MNEDGPHVGMGVKCLPPFFLNPESHSDLTQIPVRSTMKLSLVHFLCTLQSVATAYGVYSCRKLHFVIVKSSFLDLFVLKTLTSSAENSFSLNEVIKQ